jgi:hypothetical protein
MKGILLFCLSFVGCFSLINAQSVTINMGSTPAHPTAILEIFSENKGILIPRMTSIQRQAIVSPATGLVVFQLDGTKGLWYFDGIKWRSDVPGNQAGELKYWNGETWVLIPPGQNGQTLTFCNGIPQWGPCQDQITQVTTNTVTALSDTSLSVNISVNVLPLSLIIESGVCYGTAINPTVFSSLVKSTGSLVGSINLNILSLLKQTSYYFRAYAKLSDGRIIYGNNLNFTTSGSSLALLVTLPATNISSNSFTLNGEVRQEGGSVIKTRGFVWSKSPNPILTNNLTTNGSGLGVFQAIINGVTGNTSYYIRSYGINDQGVVYGNEIIVKTLTSADGGYGRFVKVNSGTFNMGSDLGNNIEKPIHSVTLNSFYLAETEVTQGLWEEIMGSDPSFNYDCDNCPVENVSWLDIQDFLKKLNTKQSTFVFRLPTEAEWEFAAKGGVNATDFLFSGSSNINEVTWFRENSGRISKPVKSKKPNSLGLYDMSGNVWEWVQDWFNFYKPGSFTNPTGPVNGSSKLYRGGSFDDISDDCRVSYRYGNPPASLFNNLGFRLAHD